MRNDNIWVVGNFLFPSGGAPAERMRNLALGLAECGSAVHVVSLAPGLPVGRGTYIENGTLVTYERIAGALAGAGAVGKICWAAGLYAAGVAAAASLGCAATRSEVRGLILYGRNGLVLLPLVLLARFYGIPVALDAVELPTQIGPKRRRLLHPIYWDWVLGDLLLPTLANGMTAISTMLVDRYRRSRSLRLLLLPPLVLSSNSCSSETRGHSPVLLYVGTLSARDAPDELFAIVRSLRRLVPTLELRLAGRIPADRQSLIRALNDSELRAVVTVTGELTRERLDQEIVNADCLILTRRDSAEEAAAFPTRLAEFLFAGRPVAASAIGDIPRYFKHKEHLLLLPPDSPQKSAEILAAALVGQHFLERMACQGQIRARRVFDRRHHARRVLRFLAQLNPNAEHAGIHLVAAE